MSPRSARATHRAPPGRPHHHRRRPSAPDHRSLGPAADPAARDARLASRSINARAETLTQKAVFKAPLARHRCLVPCDGFYEWTRHGRQHTPHYIHACEPQVLTMAGLYSVWTSLDRLEVVTFTIITTSANAAVRPLHDRMPVFLDQPARQRWLAGPTEDLPSLTQLLVPWRGALTSYQGLQVNQVAVDDPSCRTRTRGAIEPAVAKGVCAASPAPRHEMGSTAESSRRAQRRPKCIPPARRSSPRRGARSAARPAASPRACARRRGSGPSRAALHRRA